MEQSKYKARLGLVFFLDENLHYDLSNDFVNSRTKPDYKFDIPQGERERMSCFYSTTKEYVKKRKIPAIVDLANPLQQKNLHCQFSGVGDLLIKTDKRSCVVIQDKIEDGGMSPVDPGTAVQHLGVEGKERGF